MTNQLTARINAEDGIAVVSRYAAAGAGIQFLALTAAAQPVEVGGGEDMTPIVYPEGVVVVAAVSAAAGAIVGAFGATYLIDKKKKKKDNQ